MADKGFIDTLFVIALISPRDQHHRQAVALASAVEGRPLVVTDAVLLEIGNALAKNFKTRAIEVIDQFFESEDVEIVRLTPSLLDEALSLYRSYPDKTWGLVDCISFVVMKHGGIIDALTFDRHFAQAGFRPLLLEVPSA